MEWIEVVTSFGNRKVALTVSADGQPIAILGYARLSTEDDGHSIERQVDELKKFGAPVANVLAASESSYEEKAYERKAFQEFVELGEALAGKVSKVRMATADQDRWGRNPTQARSTVKHLESLGVECWCLDRGRITYETPLEGFTADIGFNVAGLYSDIISYKVKRSVKWRMEHCIPIGKVPFGYVFNAEKTRYLINRARMPKHGASPYEIGRYAIAHILNTGESTLGASRSIRERFGYIWEASSLRKWLKSPTTAGAVVYRDRPPIWGAHEPILTLCERGPLLEQLNRTRGKFAEGLEGRYLTGGMCRCAHCGRRMALSTSYLKSGEVVKYFYCYNVYCETRGGCVRADVLEARIIQEIAARGQQLADMALSGEEEPTPEMQELLAQKVELETLGHSGIPEIQSALARVESELQRLRAAQLQVGQAAGDRLELAQLLSVESTWADLSAERKRIVFRDLVDKVIIRNKVILEVKLRI